MTDPDGLTASPCVVKGFFAQHWVNESGIHVGHGVTCPDLAVLR
jgi:hypothetical protein